MAGAEGLLNVLAGDLAAAGYAVRVDGEQDTYAVPGAGSDLGGRRAGGQPQRQRGMAKVVGTACRLGAFLAWDGRGTGLVPDPAVEAFAERAASGAPEQPPVCGASEGPQVPVQEADKLRGDRDRPAGAFRAEFEAARFAWRAVASPGTRRPGKRLRECQLSPAARGEGAGAGAQRDGFGGAQRRVVQAAEERGQLRADPRPGSPAPRQVWPLTAGPPRRTISGAAR